MTGRSAIGGCARGRAATAALLFVLQTATGAAAQSPAPAVTGSEPVIHMPFGCGEIWTASTRFEVDVPTHDGLPAEQHGGHRPSPNAVDFDRADDYGVPVYAGADGGTVVSTYTTAGSDAENDANAGYGNSVDIAYPGGVTLRFAHLDSVTVGEDEPAGSIMADTQVGTVGATGLGMVELTDEAGTRLVPSTAYHLHYEQRVGDDVRLPVIEGVAWAVGTHVADDHDDLANHPGIANTSANCGPGTSPSPGAWPPPVLSGHWIEPVGGATIGPRPTLTAWPVSALKDIAVSRVVFHARWEGGGVEACDVDEGGADGLWSCTADLSAAGVPAGPLELSFDVFDDAGDMTTSADTVRVTLAVGAPKAAWARGATKDASHAAFGDVVELVARVSDSTDLAEVRFTAYYPGWANPRDAARVSGFDPERTWRTLAVCRPRGVSGEPAMTRGCRWEGDRRSATVTYTWDPTLGEKTRSVPGVPKADPAITADAEACVPVTLGIDVADALGSTASAPGGKVARRCDATADGVGRTVYLDPPVRFSDAEGWVLEGIPASFRDTCEPRREDLPQGTVAAIDCYPASQRIRAMAFYLMTADDADAVLRTRMREHRAATFQGGCMPDMGGSQMSFCYIDETNHANIRYVANACHDQPLRFPGLSVRRPTVYWAVLGTGSEVGPLWRAVADLGDWWFPEGSVGSAGCPPS